MPKKAYRKQRKRLNKRKYESKKYQTSGHVARIPKINLKPTNCARRVFWRNTIYITNTTQNPPMPWYQTFNLNSPWIVNPSQNLSGSGTSGSLSTNANSVMMSHTNGQAVTSGTAYKGLFDVQGSVGRSYRQMCVVGTKVKAAFTPQFESANVQPTGLFTCVLAGPNSTSITPTSCTASTIENLPYSRIRKVLGSESVTSGSNLSNTKSAFTQLKYSAKKFNDVKDIKDSAQMWANVQSSGTSYVGSHPAEMDRVVIGLCPLLNTPLDQKSLVSGMLEVSFEAVVLFREPNSNLDSDVAPIQVTDSAAGLAM